jgi:tetratricopeptide (TPR) repeat protein
MRQFSEACEEGACVIHVHVTEEDLRSFAAGTLDLARRRHVLSCLLSQCPRCRDIASRPTGEGSELYPPSSYDGIFARLLAKAPAFFERIQAEHAARERFLALVRPLNLSVDQILDRLMDEAVPARARADVLMALSFEQRAKDPGKMLMLALVARLIALNLPKSDAGAEYSPKEIADLQARAWGELANAYRVTEDHPGAENALSEAEAALSQGTGDLMIHARLLDVKASLRTDQRLFEEADDLLASAHTLYLEVGETHLAARAQISRGIGFRYDGRCAEAVAVLREAVGLLDSDRDPQLLAVGRQALLDAMTAKGDYAEAAEIYLKSGLREAFAGEPLNRLKVRWLEARLLAGLGKHRRAERAFAEVHGGFLEAGVDYEGALVALEYAGVLFEQSRYSEVEILAEEALETFELLKIGREAIKAVRTLHRAFAARRATQTLVREVVQFLERFDHRPNLRFKAP